ncbi:MAG: hypothetical protein ACKO72_10215 [Actinomycetes bacterium]
MIRQLPPGPRRPPALEAASATGRTGVLAVAVRSGRYQPALDAVVEAVLPWLVAAPSYPLAGPSGAARATVR